MASTAVLIWHHTTLDWCLLCYKETQGSVRIVYGIKWKHEGHFKGANIETAQIKANGHGVAYKYFTTLHPEGKFMTMPMVICCRCQKTLKGTLIPLNQQLKEVSKWNTPLISCAIQYSSSNKISPVFCWLWSLFLCYICFHCWCSFMFVATFGKLCLNLLPVFQ